MVHHLRSAGVEGLVVSAGVHADAGAPATANAIRVMRERGLDISEHRSRVLTPRLVAAAHLVIGMTREHLREAVLLDHRALRRAFTLKELVRRSRTARRDDEPLAPWREMLSGGRQPIELLGESAADDVSDPIGGPLREYRDTARELDQLMGQFVESAWSLGRGSGQP